MQNLTVKKDNALVNASYNFSTTEKRLILMAIALGQNDISGLHRITALDFAEAYKITDKAAYVGLKEAAKQLFERRFSWTEKTKLGNTKHILARWVSRVSYADGEGFVELRFSEDVLPLLSKLQERFTVYNLKHIAGLTSFYAIRLYELLIAWRSTGKTPVFELEEFRAQLGVLVDEYPRMTNFKQRVLDIAITQINEHTDITVAYEQHKRGRSISGFSFRFKQKQAPDRDPDTIDFINGAPDNDKPKRKKITRSQAMAMALPGESWQDLYHRLSSNGYVII